MNKRKATRSRISSARPLLSRASWIRIFCVRKPTVFATWACIVDANGYELQPSEKPGTLVAIIRHIDLQTVRPVTARVTFYFDTNGKLNTVEMTRIPNQPIE